MVYQIEMGHIHRHVLKAQTPTCLNKTFHMIYSVIYSLGHLNLVSPVSLHVLIPKNPLGKCVVCIDNFQNNLNSKNI